LANTAALWVARPTWLLALVVVLSASLVLSACSAGADFGEQPEATPTEQAGSFIPVPTRLPLAATRTAEANAVPFIIERVVLTTELAPDGGPANEVSVLSEEQQNIFLAVRVRDVPPDTRFRAVWFENSSTIGQSDVRTAEQEGSVQWVALPFRSIARLNPAATHSVDLIVGEQLIDSYAFRVGVGNVSDVIAEATLARGTTDDGQPVSPDHEFDRFSPQIVLVARISNMVDPTGMIFTSHWMRGNVPLGQRSPDGGQPGSDSRIMTFTLIPEGNLVPGAHTVMIMLNGTQIAAYNFTVLSDDAESSDPEPTEPAEPTPTEVLAGVEIRDIVVTREVDDDTSEPVDGFEVVEGFPSEALDLIVAIRVVDLTAGQTVELSIGIGNSIIERYRLPDATLDNGWLASEVEFRAPDIPDRTVVYEIFVYVDGQRVSGTTLSVVSSQPAPEPTATPNPFDPDPDDDEDDEDD
jgi:hypothetical protein